MIHFMKLRWLYFTLSGLVILPGVVSLVLFGLCPSIDFTGGTELELKIIDKNHNAITEEALKKETEGVLDIREVRMLKNSHVLIKTVPIELAKKDEAVQKLQVANELVEEVRYETVGPVLGRELLVKTLVAVALSAGGIMLYVAYRFKEMRYGVCAVLAMFHDMLVLIGTFSLLGYFLHVEVDVLFVTAVLTILSFSVHDTIVVYDRIRELRRKERGLTYVEMIDTAVTETLSRSLNNSLTIIFMLLALWLLGGETIRWFVFALLIGTIVDGKRRSSIMGGRVKEKEENA
ncbi:MAG: SecF protein [Microgenomates group bacterium GW2011_GWB1_45_17]|nr:MAG: SecF protein [Microgenomates group bacterium GW2011_GWB1_45_17]